MRVWLVVPFAVSRHKAAHLVCHRFEKRWLICGYTVFAYSGVRSCTFPKLADRPQLEEQACCRLNKSNKKITKSTCSSRWRDSSRPIYLLKSPFAAPLLRSSQSRMPILAKLLSSWMGTDEPAKPPTQQPTQAQPPPPPPPQQATAQTQIYQPQHSPEEQFRRSVKQLGLFAAGAGFLTLSTLITRRAVARRMVESAPKMFQPSHHGPVIPPRGQKDKGDDAFVAVEALGLATLNVFSFGVMMTGGFMWAFDISNIEDLRRKARASLYGVDGVVDSAAEQQVEEWIAEVLSKKEKREKERGNDGKKNG